MASTESPRLKAGAKVELDSDTTAQLVEILRDGLVSSGAVLASEFPETEQATGGGGAEQRTATGGGKSKGTKKYRRSTAKKR